MGDRIFLVPRGAEAAAVRRAVPRARVVELRAGAASAEAGAGIDPPATAIVLGLCGGLRALAVGQVVVYRSVAGAAGVAQLDDALAMSVAASLGGAPIVAACTVDHVVTTTDERRSLASRYDADVVDMEGTYVAATLAARDMRVAMVRVISDDASRDLPALENAITASGGLDAPRVALAFLRAPRGALRFVRDAQSALRRLGEIARILDTA